VQIRNLRQECQATAGGDKINFPAKLPPHPVNVLQCIAMQRIANAIQKMQFCNVWLIVKTFAMVECCFYMSVNY